MKIMEKKKYNKPRVNTTKLDSVINLVMMSCIDENDPDCEPTVPAYPTEFLNPLKWFK